MLSTIMKYLSRPFKGRKKTHVQSMERPVSPSTQQPQSEDRSARDSIPKILTNKPTQYQTSDEPSRLPPGPFRVKVELRYTDTGKDIGQTLLFDDAKATLDDITKVLRTKLGKLHDDSPRISLEFNVA
jgi:hypothetical protein